MTKLTFDVDFNKDPEEILKEIQERAKAEVAKRESKIKYAAFLSKLHEKVNEEIGTEFKSINDLIRALTQFANPKLKEKISSSETGRRITISMTGELFNEIKSKLALPNPNKAAIARETGASVVQVRKVANGGYDQKFAVKNSSNISILSTSKSASPPKAGLSSSSLPGPSTETQDLELTLPEVSQEVVIQPDEKTDLNSLNEPSRLEISTPSEILDDVPPIAPPSFGEELAEIEPPLAPPPAPSLELPSEPPVVEPPAPESSVTAPSNPQIKKPTLSLKPKGTKPGIGGKPGKPTLSLKTGKKKPSGLKITRPPMKPPFA